MAGLTWIAVLLTLSLSVGKDLAVDQNYLRESVQQILNAYRIKAQFSVAVNIPEDRKKFGDIFKSDKPETVKGTYGGGGVYTGTKVVAATFKKGQRSGKPFTEHAEARVLDNIEGLAQRRDGDFLMIYSFLSPCGAKCAKEAHQYNILDKIRNDVKPRWTDSAFVFTTVFDQTSAGESIPLEETKQALKNLASAIGENNVFRCYKPWGSDFKCIKCYNNGVVEAECIQNE